MVKVLMRPTNYIKSIICVCCISSWEHSAFFCMFSLLIYLKILTKYNKIQVDLLSLPGCPKAQNASMHKTY
jgi:hypothetical protein